MPCWYEVGGVATLRLRVRWLCKGVCWVYGCPLPDGKWRVRFGLVGTMITQAAREVGGHTVTDEEGACKVAWSPSILTGENFDCEGSSEMFDCTVCVREETPLGSGCSL